MLFQFEVPDEVVELLELSEDKPIEEVLDKHFREWWFGKTHHEADLIRSGKHSRIPTTDETERVADTVRAVMYADSQPLDIDPDKAARIDSLRKLVKKAPKDPWNRKPTKAEKAAIAQEKSNGLGLDEEGKPRKGMKARATRLKAVEKEKDKFRKALEPFEKMRAEIDAFDRDCLDRAIEQYEEKRFKPKVRKVDGVGE